MPADLLDNRVIKVTRIAHQLASDVVGVLQALEHLILEGELRALPELHPLVLNIGVDVLHPAVVSSSSFSCDMLLENHDVGVRDLLRVSRREDRSGTVMDRVNDHR